MNRSFFSYNIIDIYIYTLVKLQEKFEFRGILNLNVGPGPDATKFLKPDQDPQPLRKD